MTQKESLDLIDECLGTATGDTLVQGLLGGSRAEWDYDEELILDIGKALARWKLRSESRKKAKT